MKMRCVSLVIAMLLLAVALPAAAEGAVTRLVFWHSMTEQAGECIDRYVADFNATVGAEKGIEVEAVFQGSYADATTKLNGVLNLGKKDDLPDVMQMDATGKMTFFKAAEAYTVDRALADHADDNLDDILQAALGNWNFSGVQLGVPFATSTTVTYYNKTVFENAGVEAPATFADIAALVGKLPTATEDGTKIDLYACVPNTPTLANWLGQLGSYTVDQKNGSEGSATRLDCVDNGALELFLTEWKALYASGALVSSSASSDAFAAGQLLMMTSSSSSATGLLKRIDGRFELGVAGYPRVNDSARAGATVSGSCLVMFDRSEERRNAAWEFVKYMTGAEVQADFAASTGYIPSNAKATETEAYQALIAEYPLYEVALQQLMDTPADMRSVTVGPAADFYYTIQSCVTEMLDEDLDPAEAADITADELNGLLEQYARSNQ